jgi:hypothetical protein
VVAAVDDIASAARNATGRSRWGETAKLSVVGKVLCEGSTAWQPWEFDSKVVSSLSWADGNPVMTVAIVV